MMDAVDPQLKRAREEIDAVLQKYDAGGVVVLTSKTHTEQWIHPPGWSGIRFTPKGEMRYRLRSAEQEKTDLTVHTIYSWFQALGPWALNLGEATRQIEEHLEVDIYERDFVPDMG